MTLRPSIIFSQTYGYVYTLAFLGAQFAVLGKQIGYLAKVTKR
ncbi:hypothetical protein GMES_0512 [Paraglaciecola mesophila KMM 241]|uniref:Uncharacterized protein n=1 Tax=Paraglaciecola mesophila KMM 241 TaxID=1128912 RepID=K6Z1H6_9ALTE|nr:hypothetical protein GMES_0512 [Paraglaciecola mesophila KMM 241]